MENAQKFTQDSFYSFRGDFEIFSMEFLQVFQAGVCAICKALLLDWISLCGNLLNSPCLVKLFNKLIQLCL